MKLKIQFMLFASFMFCAGSAFTLNMPVELVHVRSYEATIGRSGEKLQQVQFDILVEDLAFQKEVSVHERGASGQWHDIRAEYVRSVNNNRELWRAEAQFPENDIHDLGFAIRYEVNGNTYWDNNYQRDYFLGSNDNSYLSDRFSVFVTEQAVVWETPEGSIRSRYHVALRNIAFDKKVEVVYTTDGWQTIKTVAASYLYPHEIYSNAEVENPNVFGIEVWAFEIEFQADETVEFAVSYTVSDATFWDNNFGLNYTLQSPF